MLKILDLGFYVTKNLYTHPNRKLDWYVFLYVADGQMEVWEEGTEYFINKGQFLFLKGGLSHLGEPKTPAFTSWYWIHFYAREPVDDCQELNSYLNAHQKLEVSSEEYNKYIKLPKSGNIKHPKSFEKKMDLMIEVYKSTSQFRAITLSLETLQLFLCVFRELENVHLPRKSDNTVQKIIEYLEKKATYTLTSNELEVYLRMNYSYLCDVFKQKTGTTIHMYNSQIFINKAIILMKNSNMNISEISNLLGFNNPFYFNRVFRKVMGCSPSEYISRLY